MYQCVAGKKIFERPNASGKHGDLNLPPRQLNQFNRSFRGQRGSF
jgi:hypothetical protein